MEDCADGFVGGACSAAHVARHRSEQAEEELNGVLFGISDLGMLLP